VRSKFAKGSAPGSDGGAGFGALRHAIAEQKLKPVSEPQLLDLQLEDGHPLKFKAGFEVAPDIDITGYESVKVPKADVCVDGGLSMRRSWPGFWRVMRRLRRLRGSCAGRGRLGGDTVSRRDQGYCTGGGRRGSGEQGSGGGTDRWDDVLIEIAAEYAGGVHDALKGARRAGDDVQVVYPADFGAAQAGRADGEATT